MTGERLHQGELEALARAVLQGCGVPEGPAADCAQVLAMADMMRLHTHGLSRLLSYGARLKSGGIDPQAEFAVEALAPAIRRIRGNNGLGPALGMLGLREAMAAAREAGIGMALVAGSNHFGPIAPYAWLAAQEGFASLIASNASTTIAPSGGSDARLGNNPMGFGFPNPDGDPIILDMAMSVAARAKIRDAARAGKPIPEGWATDAGGRPTTDPNAALKGFLLPLGGYKGYGLSLCVDMLTGLLSGAAYLTHVKSWVDEPEAAQNLGHAFVLIDTARLMPRADLATRMGDFADILHASPPVDPDHPVMVPGEREMRHFHAARANGVALPEDLLATLRQMAG
ncbi:Ldh family oxidoreductase [Halovulum dunhuangense]|uniref:Ldh family oxidoreductase n=1 Tax=Halovulum dunhuangense TaxID=1505036 RepID=A0A849L666_9RHOB|nr:Ldh family oxidoreductase [Halovulum dunhuangense]NNU81733.1 Ldh family oxidoreductase [Halovulum dunhuangense]